MKSDAGDVRATDTEGTPGASSEASSITDAIRSGKEGDE